MYLCLMNSGKGPQFTYQTFILYTLHLPHNQVMIDCPSDVWISSWNSFPFHLLLLDIVLIPCQAPILILHLYRLLYTYLHNLVRYNITSLVGSYICIYAIWMLFQPKFRLRGLSWAVQLLKTSPRAGRGVRTSTKPQRRTNATSCFDMAVTSAHSIFRGLSLHINVFTV